MRRVKVALETDKRRGTRRLRWTIDGVTYREALGHLDKHQAEHAREVREAALHAERLGLLASSASPAAPPTVDDVLDLHLIRLEESRGVTRYTRGEAVKAGHIRERLGYLRCDRLTTDDLRRYALARSRDPGRAKGASMSRATIFNELGVLRRAMQEAHRSGVLATQGPVLPGRKVLPQDGRRRGLILEDEMKALLGWVLANPSAQPNALPVEQVARMLTVYYWLPARPAELCSLTVGDVALLVQPGLSREERLVRFRRTKGGEGRGLRPVAEPALQALVEQLRSLSADGPPPPDAWLWPGECGRGHAGTQAVYRWLKAASEGAGVEDVQPYDLRRHAVTAVLRALGGDLEQARIYTGHNSPTTLVRYLRADAQQAASVAARIGWAPEPLRLVEREEG